jgi:hypothetical protein
MENNAISSKIKANAVCSYLLLFVSIFFLFNKENKYLNNDFVKSHVKTAFSIHILFLITYIIFISSSLFGWIFIFELSLGDLIAKAIFLLLLTWLITWIYKANSWKPFGRLDIFHFAKSSPEKIIDINGDGKFWEKDKITILISYIPLLWFLNYAQYQKNNIIRNNTKVNIFITTILFLLYIYSHYNLGNLLALFYTIFIVFAWVSMFAKNQIIHINLQNVPTIKELSYIVRSLWKYISNYFWNKKFVSLNEIVKKKIADDIQLEKKELQELEKKKESRIPSFLIYIPYINLIFLFIRNTKYQFHIRNWLTITSLLILSQIAAYFWYYNSDLNRFIMIPILFGIWYGWKESIYKMAFIYDIYELSRKLISVFWFKTKQINEMRKKETKVHLKVEK